MALKITIGIALLGFLPLLIGLWKRRRIRNLVEKGDRVMGTVLDITTHRGHKGSTYYRALIEYPVFLQAPLQRYYTFAGKKGLNLFYRGNKVEIYYDKNKPERFIPKEMSNSNFLLVFGIIMAVIYLLISYFLYGYIKGQGV